MTIVRVRIIIWLTIKVVVSPIRLNSRLFDRFRYCGSHVGRIAIETLEQPV